jgi:hypothetical protein
MTQLYKMKKCMYRATCMSCRYQQYSEAMHAVVQSPPKVVRWAKRQCAARSGKAKLSGW